jgi:hypothetical protein
MLPTVARDHLARRVRLPGLRERSGLFENFYITTVIKLEGLALQGPRGCCYLQVSWVPSAPTLQPDGQATTTGPTLSHL